MLFFFAFFLGIFLFGIKIRKVPAEGLDRTSTEALKGMCAISVIFHHLGNAFGWSELPFVGMINYDLGVFPVAVFFMLSGYGLSVQYEKKGKAYLKRILFVKTPLLYLEFVAVNALYFLCLGSGLSARQTVLSVFGFDWLHRMSPNAWFVYTILCAYVLFSVSYFLFPRDSGKTALVAICVVCLVFKLVFCLVNVGDLYLYARAVECFPLGILYAVYRKKLDPALAKFTVPILATTVFFFVVGLRFDLEIVLATLVCLSAICLCRVFSIGNAFSRGLGRISLWIYLLHGLFLTLFSSVAGETVTAFLTLVYSIVAAAVCSFAQRCVRRLFSASKRSAA